MATTDRKCSSCSRVQFKDMVSDYKSQCKLVKRDTIFVMSINVVGKTERLFWKNERNRIMVI